MKFRANIFGIYAENLNDTKLWIVDPAEEKNCNWRSPDLFQDGCLSVWEKRKIISHQVYYFGSTND